jgi:hypothetical protein
MAAQALPAKAEMAANPPTALDGAWTIIQKYVVLGLTAGVVAVPAVAGTVGGPTVAFAGVGAGSAKYK